MAQQQKLMFLYCEENLHAGAGSSTGTIDLPIQRESHTGYPKLESSSLRGALRESIADKTKKYTDAYNAHKKTGSKEKFIGEKYADEWIYFERVFGKWDSGDQQSAIDFPDAKLLLFPVRSHKGVFAWITCPLALARFENDYSKWTGKKLDLNVNSFEPENDEIIIQSPCGIDTGNQVLLEEFLFTVKPVNNFPKIANTKDFGDWLIETVCPEHPVLQKMKTQIAIVSDDVFRDFVMLYTPKMTRNRISPDTGTADGGALFNEEFLPSESLMYSFVLASDEFSKSEDFIKSDEVMQFFVDNRDKLVRIGGDKGIGKGLVRISLTE